MKNTLLILIGALLIQSTLVAQSCLPDGIIFTSQAQIDSFPYNYPSCSEIEGFVTIGPLNSWDEIDISNLDSLINITSIEGNFKVWNNDILPNLIGMDNLQSVGGDLLIETNSSVENLVGLEGLTEVGGMLRIYGGNYITALAGLDNLMSVGGDLSISYGNALMDLSSLESLVSIGGEMSITSNASLESLDGLNNIDAATITALTITNNGSLSTCAVESICNYLIENGMNVTIVNNVSGCNNEIEIANACFNTINEESELSELSVYPNPVNNTLYISGDESVKIEEIAIYNQIGQRVVSKREEVNRLDVSELETGVYLIEVISVNSKIFRKLIVE